MKKSREENPRLRRLSGMRSIVAGLLIVGSGFGQTFEVASVRLAAPDQRMGNLYQGGPGTDDPTRFTGTNVVLAGLLARAFGVMSDQITAPDWVNAVRLEISATVPEGATKEQLDLMLQNLLAERFHMSYHKGSKEFPAYTLSVAKNGAKLTAADGKPGINMRVMASCTGDHVTARNRDSSGVAQALQSAAGMRVIDKTGLTGKYDVELYVAIDHSNTRGMRCGDTPPDAPSLTEAVEKQLGLKLEKTSVTLDMIVIDHLDKSPADN